MKYYYVKFNLTLSSDVKLYVFPFCVNWHEHVQFICLGLRKLFK